MTITSSSFGSGGAGSVQKWVSGTTYALDDLAWSPISYLTYIRKVAGAGATDPSADGTNWEIFGPSKIRRIRRGTITIVGNTTTGTGIGTATLSPTVDTTKTELRFLGYSSNIQSGVDGNVRYHIRIELTNSSTITATRSNATVLGDGIVSYEVVEWW